MDITEVSTKNLDNIESLIHFEHDHKGMINGRDMIIADSEIIIEAIVTLPELFAIKTIATNFSISKSFDKTDDAINYGLSIYTDDKRYEERIKSMVASIRSAKKDVENSLLTTFMPIGTLCYTVRCSFVGGDIRILMATGSYYELIGEEYNVDECIDKIPEFFYKAVYKEMFARISFYYDTINSILMRNRYKIYGDGDNLNYHVLRVTSDFGASEVTFLNTGVDEIESSVKEFVDEAKELRFNGLTIGNVYAVITCKASLFVYYMLKIHGIKVIDEEPIKTFLVKDIKDYEIPDWSKYFPGTKDTMDLLAEFDRGDETNIVRMMGLTPAGAMINFTVKVNLSTQEDDDILKELPDHTDMLECMMSLLRDTMKEAL